MKTPKKAPKAGDSKISPEKKNVDDPREKGRTFSDDDEEDEDFDMPLDDDLNDFGSYDDDDEEDY